MKIIRDRKLIYQLTAGLLLIIVTLIVFIGRSNTVNEDIIPVQNQPADSETHSEESIENELVNNQNQESIIIEMAGQVSKPAVYILKEGSRVYEGIEAAGGLTEHADTRSTNLAAPLHDGMKLYIPSKTEVEAMENASELPAGSSYYEGSTDLYAAMPDKPSKININSANLEQLQQLTGVGPSTANKIIEYRKEYGIFNSPEELMNVSGIGEKTFEKLKEFITVE